MSWFGWITGSGETADKVVDSAISGLDALFFTEEEKSVASQKVLDWKLEYLKATGAQNVARRVISLTITAMWVVLIVTAVAAKMFGSVEFSNFVFAVLAENVNTPFSIILGFYFLAHVVGKARK